MIAYSDNTQRLRAPGDRDDQLDHLDHLEHLVSGGLRFTYTVVQEQSAGATAPSFN